MDPSQYLSLASTLAGAGSMAFPPLGVAQGVLGGIQTAVALKRLADLRKEKMPSYLDNIAPLQENVNMWEQRMNQGIPQSFLNQATQQNAQGTASAYRYINDTSGGQLGGAFSRVAALDRVRFATSIAAMNDQARREAMGYLANARSQLVQQQNQQTAQDLRYRQMREQALGQALRAGTQNLTGFLDYGLSGLIKPGGQTAQPVATTPTSELVQAPQQGITPVPAQTTPGVPDQIPFPQNYNLTYPQNILGPGGPTSYIPVIQRSLYGR
jgi:hypothetical protein